MTLPLPADLRSSPRLLSARREPGRPGLVGKLAERVDWKQVLTLPRGPCAAALHALPWKAGGWGALERNFSGGQLGNRQQNVLTFGQQQFYFQEFVLRK